MNGCDIASEVCLMLEPLELLCGASSTCRTWHSAIRRDRWFDTLRARLGGEARAVLAAILSRKGGAFAFFRGGKTPPPVPLDLDALVLTLEIEQDGVVLHNSVHAAAVVLRSDVTGWDLTTLASGVEFDLGRAVHVAGHRFPPVEPLVVSVCAVRASDAAVAPLIARQYLGESYCSGYPIMGLRSRWFTANPTLRGLIPCACHVDTALVRVRTRPADFLEAWLTHKLQHDDVGFLAEQGIPVANVEMRVEALIQFGTNEEFPGPIGWQPTLQVDVRPSIVVRPDGIDVHRIVVSFEIDAVNILDGIELHNPHTGEFWSFEEDSDHVGSTLQVVRRLLSDRLVFVS